VAVILHIKKGSDRGTLRAGAWGDVTILDPDMEWTFKAAQSKSKSHNTPFDNWKMRGAAIATIVAGRIVYLHPEYLRAKIKEDKAALVK
jgi:dihydroorotase